MPPRRRCPGRACRGRRVQVVENERLEPPAKPESVGLQDRRPGQGRGGPAVRDGQGDGRQADVGPRNSGWG